MQELNDKQNNIIAEFALHNNVDLFLVHALIVAVDDTRDRKKVGKKMTQDSIDLMEQLKDITSEKDAFTSHDMAIRFNAQPTYVSNALSRMEKEGAAKRVGKAPQAPGKRGKPHVLWQFV